MTKKTEKIVQRLPGKEKIEPIKPKRIRFMLRAVVDYSIDDIQSLTDLMERIIEDGECEITAAEIIEEEG